MIAQGKRLRVLLITYGCDATDVGEAWSSFRWVTGLSRLHDVTVLTSRWFRRPSPRSQLPGVRVVEWPAGLDRFGRISSMLKPGYLLFYFRARNWIRRALARGEQFDLIHQISPLAIRYPSPGAGCGVPLILGPLGGSIDAPSTFRDELKSLPWYTRLRGLDRWRLKHDPWLRGSISSASLVLGVAPYVRAIVAGSLRGRFQVMSETGVESLPKVFRSTGVAGEVRMLFVGRLTRSKGVRDAIRALGSLGRKGRWRFDILGDGEDRVACEHEARLLGVSEYVRFHGQVPRSVVGEFLVQADIFLFPSFREPSGNALLEALAFGVPAVVADTGGPGHVVTEECGFRVAASDPESFSFELADALRRLLDDPKLRQRMGEAARKRVGDVFLWRNKIVAMSEIYHDVVKSSCEGK